QPMKTYMHIKPNSRLLEWARDVSGHTIEMAAKRMRVNPTRLSEWESGALTPTVKQMQNLGKLYGRPLAFFFQKDSPEEPPVYTEFRRLPGIQPGAEPPEIRLAMRKLSYKREAFLNLMKELGEDIL